MWNWFLNLFKKKEVKIVSGASKRFALVVGHTKSNYGTETYKDEHEYDWNNDVVNMIIEKLNHTNVFRIERKNLTYTKAMVDLSLQTKAKGADIAIEFHLNAAGIPTASGCEMLVHKNKKSMTKALEIIKYFSGQFGIKLRNGGLKKLADADRGGAFVREMEKQGIDAYLIEPFFCDYKTKDSEQFIEAGGKEKYADFWVSVIRNW